MIARVAIALALLLVPCRAFAEECKRTVMVETPCRGYLVPGQKLDAARLLGEAAKEVGCDGPGAPECLLRLRAELGHARADLAERTRQRDAERKRGDRLDARLQEVSTAPRRPWHEHPAFVATATALSVGLAAVAVWQIAEAL